MLDQEVYGFGTENHLLTQGVGWFLESLLQEMPVDENHLLTQGVGWFLESLLQEMPVDENHELPLPRLLMLLLLVPRAPPVHQC